MPKGRKGRPRRADAKRRATTRAGRAPAIDRGTDELRRLRQLLNGRLDLPTTPLAALYSREYISEAQYKVGLYFAALTAISRAGWALSEGSVDGLWRAIGVGSVGTVGIPFVPAANGHDRAAGDAARTRLTEMRAALGEGEAGAAILRIVMDICVDGAWPLWLKRILAAGAGARHRPRWAGDYSQLGLLREGLHRLAELRPSRRAGVSEVRAEAAE